jgi:hypothetical protein
MNDKLLDIVGACCDLPICFMSLGIGLVMYQTLTITGILICSLYLPQKSMFVFILTCSNIFLQSNITQLVSS